jgi:hypothetical protein
LTGYDEQHLITYLRLLDVDAEGTGWQEVAKSPAHREADRTAMTELDISLRAIVDTVAS